MLKLWAERGPLVHGDLGHDEAALARMFAFREELSRASVRVTEAVARRQAAERINRRARKSRHDAEDPPSESESDDD